MSPVTDHSAKGRLLSVDALRGVGALLVAIVHSRNIFWTGLHSWLADGAHSGAMRLVGLLTYPFSLGGWGVALFFVLSGYCIHRPNGHLLTVPGGRVDLRKHAVRRLWRIYPVLVGAILLTAALDGETARLVPSDPLLGNTGFASAVVNLTTMQGILGPFYGSNLPLWSLGPEVHVYVLYPLLFLACRRWGPNRLLAASALVSIASVSLGFLAAGRVMPAVFPYLFSWVCGMFIAEVEGDRATLPVRPTLWIVLLLGLVTFGAQSLLPQVAMIVEGPFFGLVLFLSIRGPLAAFWNHTGLRWLAWIGTFSFSLYVVHYPVLLLLRAVLFGGQRQPSLWLPYAGIAVATGVAWVFYQCIERFSLRPPRILMRESKQT